SFWFVRNELMRGSFEYRRGGGGVVAREKRDANSVSYRRSTAANSFENRLSSSVAIIDRQFRRGMRSARARSDLVSLSPFVCRVFSKCVQRNARDRSCRNRARRRRFGRTLNKAASVGASNSSHHRRDRHALLLSLFADSETCRRREEFLFGIVAADRADF